MLLHCGRGLTTLHYSKLLCATGGVKREGSVSCRSRIADCGGPPVKFCGGLSSRWRVPFRSLVSMESLRVRTVCERKECAPIPPPSPAIAHPAHSSRIPQLHSGRRRNQLDRKSTRLNSSHANIYYAV